MRKEGLTQWLIALVLFGTGVIMILLPNLVYEWILNLSILYCILNTFFLIHVYFKKRKKVDLAYAILSMVFALVLMRWQFLPEWFIRVAFGTYCLMSAAASAIQMFIDLENQVKHQPLLRFVNMASFGILGAFLLLESDFSSDLLLNFFGIYFIIMSLRFLADGWALVEPGKNYKWRRRVRIMLPPLISAFMPDWLLSSINHHLQEEKDYVLQEHKSDEEPALKVMVHVGPEGFQKIGHISFAFEDVVYSYGNYDSESFHLNGTLGDGVFFNVCLEDYIPNMMQAENNSIFEYGIHLTSQQKEQIRQVLAALKARSFRWYTWIEREDGYNDFAKYEKDYPSRLHYRTGAKMYKLKSGKFRTYWALGDNCASFTDLVLGKLGADVLNIRGIISPGTYLDFLQTEYARPNSPVITRTYHPNPKSASAS